MVRFIENYKDPFKKQTAPHSKSSLQVFELDKRICFYFWNGFYAFETDILKRRVYVKYSITFDFSFLHP